MTRATLAFDVMRPAALVLLCAAALLAGCGADPVPREQATTTSTTAPPAKKPAPRPTPTPKPKPVPRPRLKRATCPADAGNCAAATGRIIYVEAVDPDGDGDLHLVVTGGNVTFPGVSVFDIEKELRPKRTPRIGDYASAAGPVYTGSYGQKQIQATELHVAYR